MNIPSDAIVVRIMTEFGYTEKRAEEVVQKLQKSNPAVQEAFEKWWVGDGLDEHLLVEGYTLQKLVEEYNFNPMNASLTMDFLIREPGRAKRALSRGYDHFLITPEAKARYEQRKAHFKKQKEQENQLDVNMKKRIKHVGY